MSVVVSPDSNKESDGKGSKIALKLWDDLVNKSKSRQNLTAKNQPCRMSLVKHNQLCFFLILEQLMQPDQYAWPAQMCGAQFANISQSSDIRRIDVLPFLQKLQILQRKIYGVLVEQGRGGVFQTERKTHSIKSL